MNRPAKHRTLPARVSGAGSAGPPLSKLPALRALFGPSLGPAVDVETAEGRRDALARMTFLRDVFYGGATQTGCHAFIEFAGLMTMFIDGCAAAEADGQPWARASVHSGSHLPLTTHQLGYLREKLACIYGARAPFEMPAGKPAEDAPVVVASRLRSRRPRAKTARARRRPVTRRLRHL